MRTFEAEGREFESLRARHSYESLANVEPNFCSVACNLSSPLWTGSLPITGSCTISNQRLVVCLQKGVSYEHEASNVFWLGCGFSGRLRPLVRTSRKCSLRNG